MLKIVNVLHEKKRKPEFPHYVLHGEIQRTLFIVPPPISRPPCPAMFRFCFKRGHRC